MNARESREDFDMDRWLNRFGVWIPVTEKLPDDEETVLIAVDGEPWTGYLEAGQWHYVCGDPLNGRVTHWMNFPDTPADMEAT